MIGISSDSVESHCAFADEEELPFPILSDPDDSVRVAYGVPNAFFGFFPGRVTFVIDRNRVVRHVYRSQLALRRHVIAARNALERIATG